MNTEKIGKEIVQSYIFTIARYDASVYAKRVMIKLVELAQKDLEGKKLGPGYMINKTLFDDLREVSIPVSAVLSGEKDENYTRVKKAIDELNDKGYWVLIGSVWQKIRIVELPKIEKYSGIMILRINPLVWAALLDFSKGYRKLQLEVAMTFKSIYAIRFYELFSGKKQPIIYSIDNLKIMFNIEKKYAGRPVDFIKYVVVSAKKELDKHSPWSFEFETMKTGRKTTHIRFIPYYIPENSNEEFEQKRLQKQTSLSWDLDRSIVQYLKQNFYFSNTEIKNNRQLLIEANKKLDLLLELSLLKRKSENKARPKAYIIGAIKGKLKDLE